MIWIKKKNMQVKFNETKSLQVSVKTNIIL